MRYNFLSVNLSMDGRILLEWILQNTVRIEFFWLRIGFSGGLFEHLMENEVWGPMKGGELLE